MSVVCRPALSLPEHVVSLEEVISHTSKQHATHTRIKSALSLMRSTSVQSRSLIDPFEEVTRFRTFGQRMRRYAEAGTRLGVDAARHALAAADTHTREVDNMILVSCTGYLLPGLDAHIANEMGLRQNVRRLSFGQVGCAGGAYALSRARELEIAHPNSVTLVISVELCSLSYQPDDSSIASFISTALFGDAAAACVIRNDRPGMRIDNSHEELAPNTLGYISYGVDEFGFHFDTNPRISRIVAETMPGLGKWLLGNSDVLSPQPGFLISHTGGPRIMYEVSKGLGIPPEMFDLSENSLKRRGNTASAVVFDVLEQTFGQPPKSGETGLMLAFGPGVSTVAVTGTWV
ncbi:MULTISPECIES: type III polyketide synthase [Streptomyces]|uniref:Type III polyketide synthase n=1 Tax=Streptomyces siderophoricus TaxID=2802281 RepID=A0ABS1N509_9ACTN|nr:3-oxoacyl-[acyl-carrier-protein] synthase III C-terminal domain-containing protein [Streptomyces sp. 9-7]MBL1095004.1 type III polyketide synthase [Streptomyces sp. 9-7]